MIQGKGDDPVSGIRDYTSKYCFLKVQTVDGRKKFVILAPLINKTHLSCLHNLP